MTLPPVRVTLVSILLKPINQVNRKLWMEVNQDNRRGPRSMSWTKSEIIAWAVVSKPTISVPELRNVS